MAINQYEPLKLNQTNRYAGYQFHARVWLDGMEPSEAFRYLILSVCSWARKKMPESDRNVPELSLPEAEEYASVGSERFVPYHISIGYALDITPLMDSGIWALRLKEPDSGIKGERDAVPGRFFTTRVGLRLNEKGYTELGIRIDITDPASVEKEKAYKDALLLAQSWSKHKSPYSYGTVVFEAEARKMEQHARVMELVNSSSMEDKDKIGQLKYEMELLFGVIDDKDRDIEELKRQKEEAFSRGVDFGEKEKAALEEENTGLRKELVNKQDQIAQMEGKYQEAKGVLGVLDELRAISVMPETREDVVQYFRKVYRDRIDFTERGLSTAAKCDLKPASLWTVLYAVANGLVDLFRNSSGNCSEKDVQECTGYRVSFGEGSMTRDNSEMMRQREDRCDMVSRIFYGDNDTCVMIEKLIYKGSDRAIMISFGKLGFDEEVKRVEAMVD